MRVPSGSPPLAAVNWVRRDGREVDLTDYDVVACLGLFYHLGPEDQVSLLKRCQVPIIIDTHVANRQSTHSLTDLEPVGDYQGAWYLEPGETTSSSWGNARSFWPTPKSLFEMLADCGFPVVMAASPWVRGDRTLFLALPDGYRRPAQTAQRSAVRAERSIHRLVVATRKVYRKARLTSGKGRQWRAQADRRGRRHD